MQSNAPWLLQDSRESLQSAEEENNWADLDDMIFAYVEWYPSER